MGSAATGSINAFPSFCKYFIIRITPISIDEDFQYGLPDTDTAVPVT